MALLMLAIESSCRSNMFLGNQKNKSEAVGRAKRGSVRILIRPVRNKLHIRLHNRQKVAKRDASVYPRHIQTYIRTALP